MYLAMKDVLDLNHLYNCSPAAVGQQVYATAILYNTLRVSQAKIAATASTEPETLSVDRLFPTLIEHYIVATCIALAAERRSQERLLKHPHPPPISVDPPWIRVRISDLLLEKRPLSSAGFVSFRSTPLQTKDLCTHEI